MSLIHLIVYSAVAYRTARFLMLDALIEEPRQNLHSWLARHPNRLTIKIQELMICPFCYTIWTALATVLVAMCFTSVPLPVYTWLASATGALVFWRIIDPE